MPEATDFRYCTITITPSNKPLFPVWNIQLCALFYPPIQPKYVFVFDFSKIPDDNFQIIFDTDFVEGTYALNRQVKSCTSNVRWRRLLPASSKTAVLSITTCVKQTHRPCLLSFSGQLNDGASNCQVASSASTTVDQYLLTCTPNMSSTAIEPVSCFTNCTCVNSCTGCGSSANPCTLCATNGGMSYAWTSSSPAPSVSLSSGSCSRDSPTCSAYPTYSISFQDPNDIILNFNIQIPSVSSYGPSTASFDNYQGPYTPEDCAGNVFSPTQIIPPLNITALNCTGQMTITLCNTSTNNGNGSTTLGATDSDNVYKGQPCVISNPSQYSSILVTFTQQTNGFFRASITL